MAKATKKSEKVSVTLVLSEEEAKALHSILLNDVDWWKHQDWKLAEAVYDALDALELG